MFRSSFQKLQSNQGMPYKEQVICMYLPHANIFGRKALGKNILHPVSCCKQAPLTESQISFVFS